jgi:hypothetical protein
MMEFVPARPHSVFTAKYVDESTEHPFVVLPHDLEFLQTNEWNLNRPSRNFLDGVDDP